MSSDDVSPISELEGRGGHVEADTVVASVRSRLRRRRNRRRLLSAGLVVAVIAGSVAVLTSRDSDDAIVVPSDDGADVDAPFDDGPGPDAVVDESDPVAVAAPGGQDPPPACAGATVWGHIGGDDEIDWIRSPSTSGGTFYVVCDSQRDAPWTFEGPADPVSVRLVDVDIDGRSEVVLIETDAGTGVWLREFSDQFLPVIGKNRILLLYRAIGMQHRFGD